MPPERTDQYQATRWPKGQSGNPNGRPRGSRNRATVAAERLLEGEAQALTRRCIELALAGDTTALRLALERIVPPRKDRSIRLSMPQIGEPRDLFPAISTILTAVCMGNMTPQEGSAMINLVETTRKTLETTVLEERITHLESVAGLPDNSKSTSTSSR